MNVREFIERLQAMPDQDATVVIAEGVHAHLWLIVSGLVPRGVKRTADNPDLVEPGSQPAVEIV